MKNSGWSGYNVHFYIVGTKVTSFLFFDNLWIKKSVNYLTPVGISIRSVVTIRSSVSVVTAIVSIPGISFGISGSVSGSISFPLLSTPVSVSVSVVSVVGSVSVVTAIVSIPGISLSNSGGISFPLLSPPVSVTVGSIVSIWSVSIVSTVSIPGISLSISGGCSVSLSLACYVGHPKDEKCKC